MCGFGYQSAAVVPKSEASNRMLYKCANTACVNLFRSLSQGKLFQIQIVAPQALRPRPMKTRKHRASSTFEHYWLCDNCSSILTLTFGGERGLTTVPLPVISSQNPKSNLLPTESRRKLAVKIAAKLESSVCLPS